MVEISNREDLKSFLKDKPFEWAQIIACRAALRVLPLWRTTRERHDSTLKIFRTLFVSRVASSWLSHDLSDAASLAGGMLNAGEATGDSRYVVDLVVRAAIEAAYAADPSEARGDPVSYAIAQAAEAIDTSAAAFAARAASAARAAGSGARVADVSARRAVWLQVSHDATLLERGGNSFSDFRQVIISKLWGSGAPTIGFQSGWQSLKYELVSREGEFWQEWVNWYERVLAGEAVLFSGLTEEDDKAFSVQLALQPDSFWGRNAAVVNNEIHGWLNALRFPEIPPQAPGALLTYERNGRVARQLPSPPDDPKGTLHSARRSLIESVDDFEAAFPSHNHSGLKQTLVRLREAFGADYDQFDIIRAGAAAERLQGFALRADEIFLPEMAVEVVALNVNIGRTLGNSEDWREFCLGLDSDADPAEPDIDAVVAVGEKLIATDALEDEVKAELKDEMLPFIVPLEGDRGRSRERKILMRGMTNVLATMSKIALKGCKAVGSAMSTGALEGVKKGSEAIVVGIFMAIAAQLYQLAGQSPTLAFLAPALNYLSTFAKKSPKE